MAPVHSRPISDKKKVEFFILDWPLQEDDQDEECETRSYHYHKTRKVKTIISRYFDCKVTPVFFDPDSEPMDVFDYFRRALRSKGSNDAVIVYYEGTAGGKGKTYKWQFEKYPDSPVNAWKLLQLFVESGIDSKFILDCYLPTRFAEKWGLTEDGELAGSGNVEIIARGGQLSNLEREVVQGDKSDFTDNILKQIKTFVTKIDVPKSGGGYLGWHAPHSLAELMAKNYDLCFNPVRNFSNLSKPGSKAIVRRFVFMPDHVRKTNKISWFMKTIERKKNNDDSEDESESTTLFPPEPVDEGYDEGSDVGSDLATEDQKVDSQSLFVTPGPSSGA